MASKPRIEYADGYFDSATNKGKIQVFVSNYSRGYLKSEVVENSTNTKSSNIICMPIFSGLFGRRLIPIRKSGTSTVNLFTCSDGESCQSLTGFCTSVNTIPVDSVPLNISSYNPAVPAAITGFYSVQTQNTLTLYWDRTDDNNVIAYYIEIIDPDNVSIQNGYILRDRSTLTLSSLSNNIVYRCNIHAITRSNISSLDTTIYSTPGLPESIPCSLDSETPSKASTVLFIGVIVTAGYVTKKLLKWW